MLNFHLLADARVNSKLVTIGSPLNTPPYLYAAEGRGLEYELMTTIFKKMGYNLAWQHLPPKRLRHQLQHGEIMVGVRLLPTKDAQLYFSHPYLHFQNVAITIDPTVQVNSIADLEKYSVVAFQNAREALGPEFAKAMPRSRSSLYFETPNHEKQLEMLFRGRTQVIVMEKQIFLHFRKQFDPNIEVKMFEIFKPTLYAVAFHDKGMRDEFDKTLQATQSKLLGQ